MPSIEEMLANTALTDDIELTLPTGKVTVGELRTYQRTKAAEAQSVRSEAEKRYREATDEMARAKSLADDAMKVIKLGEQTTPPPDRNAIDWDTDPVYAPMNKRLAEKLGPLEAALTEVAQMKKTLDGGLAFVVDDYYERRWTGLQDRPKDKTYRDYVEVATKQNIKDRWGLPDPVAAYLKETEADRLSAAVDEARKKGIEEGKKAAATASIPRPGFQTPTTGRTPGDKPLSKGDLGATLREQMAKAASDPEILRVAGVE